MLRQPKLTRSHNGSQLGPHAGAGFSGHFHKAIPERAAPSMVEHNCYLSSLAAPAAAARGRDPTSKRNHATMILRWSRSNQTGLTLSRLRLYRATLSSVSAHLPKLLLGPGLPERFVFERLR